MTVVAQFIKPINAYKESDNSAIDYTALTSTDKIKDDTITYTFKSVEPATFNDFYFNESYIAEKIAEGYTQVSFVIDTWGNKEASLYENETEVGHVLTNGNDGFDCGIIPLTEDAYYYIRLYHNLPTGDPATSDIDVVVKFYKSVYGCKSSDKSDIAYTSATSTTITANDTITYTFDTVENGTFNDFYFTDSFIAEKMAEGYTNASFVVSTWGNKAATLYENETEKGSVTTNGNDGFDCGVIELTEDAYYRISLYHNLPTGAAEPSDIDVVVQFIKPEAAILSDLDSWGLHYHGYADSVSAGGGAISVHSVQYGSTFRGFTLTTSAIQALYDAGISTLAFTITVPEGCYIDIYNMADPSSCIAETPVFIDGTEYYYASGTTVTLNIENLVGGLNNAEGLKFVVTYGASWTAYNADCNVTFSNITTTAQA
jgi:proteasome lid subunit RPN8/RPN11